MKKLMDLRFVIGIFFSVAGLLLLGYGLMNQAGSTINLWCGIIYVIFGGGMVGVSVRG